jgi:hypothetical protein
MKKIIIVLAVVFILTNGCSTVYRFDKKVPMEQSSTLLFVQNPGSKITAWPFGLDFIDGIVTKKSSSRDYDTLIIPSGRHTLKGGQTIVIYTGTSSYRAGSYQGPTITYTQQRDIYPPRTVIGIELTFDFEPGKQYKIYTINIPNVKRTNDGDVFVDDAGKSYRKDQDFHFQHNIEGNIYLFKVVIEEIT